MRLTSEYRAGLFTLTGICGLIDVACFVGIAGVFAELMTGNLLLIGISIGTRSFDPSVGLIFASAVAAFLLGAFAAGLLTNGKYPHAARVIGYPVEYACVVVATIATLVTQPPLLQSAGSFTAADGYLYERSAIIATLAFGMGIHNAIMRKHGVPDIATNVMTLTLTGLVSESRRAGGPATHWQRRLASVLIFVAGACLGGFLLQYGAGAPLAAASVLFTIALYPLMKGRHPSDSPLAAKGATH
jgi:uncharacterized membrane protein YoaK (UPF0700 family)